MSDETIFGMDDLSCAKEWVFVSGVKRTYLQTSLSPLLAPPPPRNKNGLIYIIFTCSIRYGQIKTKRARRPGKRDMAWLSRRIIPCVYMVVFILPNGIKFDIDEILLSR